MIKNYWLEQHNKQVLAENIRKHLHNKYKGVYEPSMVQELSREISSYLKTANVSGYKVHVRLSLEKNELTIEIP